MDDSNDSIPARPPAPSLGRTPVTASARAAWEHPRILLCALATLLAMPVLLVAVTRSNGSGPEYRLETAAASFHETIPAALQATSTSEPVATTTPEASTSTSEASPSSTSAPASTSTTTEATTPGSTGDATSLSSPTDAPATTVPAWSPPPSTTPPTTAWTPPSTTAAPTTTAPPATTAPSGNRITGQATHYDRVGMYGRTATGCAMLLAPQGTVVTVTHGSKSITCLVDDFGPYGAGRIVDLSFESFSQLAPLGTGVIDVTVTW